MKVAICIPYYRKIEELKRLIYSIISQTFTDYVVIVTDDSSDVRAEKFISNLDERFTYKCNKIKLGPTRNCNHAIRLAQSYEPQYIKVMHHDDYFNYDESLKEYVEMLDTNPEAVFAFSGSKTDICWGKEVYERFADANQIQSLHENKYSIIAGNFIGAPSAVITRNVGIMMDENLVWLVDVDWYLKLLEYQNCFEFVQKPLIVTGLDGNRVSDACLKDAKLLQKEYLYVYLKHSAMQDFSYLDRIIQQCIIYYRSEKGYWHEDDYLAILKDAISDGKKICIWENEKIGMEDGYELLRQKGIEIDCYLDDNTEKSVKAGMNNVPRMNLQEFEERKKDYFCIVMLEKAKEIRKLLAHKGINSLPYIERYIRNIDRTIYHEIVG